MQSCGPKLVYVLNKKKDAKASSFNVAGTGGKPVSAAADMSPSNPYLVKTKKDAEASSLNVEGTGLEPVSAEADMSPEFC